MEDLIKKFPKYENILIEQFDQKILNKNFDRFEKFGKINVEKYIISTRLNVKYSDFLKNKDINVSYIGYLEYILDKNINPGVGYGVVYDILNDKVTNKQSGDNDIKNQIFEKQRSLKNYYESINDKYDNENDFYTFLNYVNADIYLSDILDNDRYTTEDVKDINIQKDFFKNDIVLNINVFLQYLYKNILKVEKDDDFLENIINKYTGAYILLLERIYKKYINDDFEVIKEPDSYFENIIIIQ
jgi:hypothetical protein